MASKSVEIDDRNGGMWGTVRRGRKYFTVETYSRYQGTRSGTVVRVPFDARDLDLGAADDLSAPYNDGMSNAEYVRRFSEDYQSQCHVARRGTIVE